MSENSDGKGFPTDLTNSHDLTVADVAAYLNIARAAVYRLIKQGELRTIRHHTETIRVPADASVAYLCEVEQASQAEFERRRSPTRGQLIREWNRRQRAAKYPC